MADENALKMSGRVIWTGERDGQFRFGLSEGRDSKAVWFGITDDKLKGFLKKGDTVTVTYIEKGDDAIATFVKREFSGGGGGKPRRSAAENRQIVQQTTLKVMAELLASRAESVNEAASMVVDMIEHSKSLADQLISGETPTHMKETARV